METYVSIEDQLEIEEGNNPDGVIEYGEPGAGAIEYASQIVGDLSKSPESIQVITQLLNGELHDTDDKQVKRCDYCRYFWRDDSLRNNKRTCCEECKRKVKTLQKRKQRERRELLNPTSKKRKKKDDYVYWLEYPYWINEESMFDEGERFEKPMKTEVLDYIHTKNQKYGVGNRKRRTSERDYGF
ncbi:hypothetical protein [Sediminibacillus massiliensis]|uniref:hypothetical protein n=1 Tax=Sediminibacillus massiliensis TaxID=1926277 RepID=UPI0009883C3F|nr:hypothetical protein [Sediminibacillus massiliensis]